MKRTVTHSTPAPRVEVRDERLGVPQQPQSSEWIRHVVAESDLHHPAMKGQKTRGLLGPTAGRSLVGMPDSCYGISEIRY
jgi:hypothetical protein